MSWRRFWQNATKKQKKRLSWHQISSVFPGFKALKLENSLVAIGAFHGQTRYGSSNAGRLAITHYRVLKKKRGISILELHPETGRTHQLRVHLSELGHPILGDLQYGRNAAFPREVQRLCLHAYSLSFIHPETGRNMHIVAPLPQLFKRFYK